MLLAYFGENALASGRNICNKTCDYCVDNGKRIREMIDELSMPKQPIDLYVSLTIYGIPSLLFFCSGRGPKSRGNISYEDDPILDEYAYDSKHNRADTDDYGDSYSVRPQRSSS